MAKFQKLIKLFSSFILVILLFSCHSYKNDPKIYLGDNLYYCDFTKEITATQVKLLSDYFEKLSNKQNDFLNALLTDKNNYLWIKTDFTIPENLKNQDLGLYIAYVRTSCECYLNGELIGSYGGFHPKEFNPGFVSNYYFFPKDSLNQGEKNTILLKIWTGGIGSISRKLYVGKAEDARYHANLTTFFSSKITMFFCGVMMLVFILYTLMFITLRKYRVHREYIVYALLNFYTVHFLLLFFTSDIPFFTAEIISYLTFLKIFFFAGAFVTTYFANSFIIRFLKVEQSPTLITVRMILLLIPILLTLFAPTYRALSFMAIPSIIFCIAQFGFSVPEIIKAFLNKERRHLAIQLLGSFTPVIVTLIIDIVVRVIFRIHDYPYFTVFGWQLTIIVFLIYLVIQFDEMYIKDAKLSSQLADFNVQLESQVKQRTQEISEKNLILTEGLKAVSNVQKNFLPPKKRTFKGWELAISYRPLVDDVSGDLFDYYYTGDNLDGIGIFDVSGHGIPSGLMTILAKGIISQHFANGLTQSEPISQVLENINKTYIKEKVNVDNYITGLLFRFSEFNKNDECSVEVANAGHPHPYLYKASSGEIIEIQYKDARKQYGMIGIDELPVSFPPVNFRMSHNDIVVCFTDGLTDAQNDKGEDFGKQKLCEIIKKYSNEPAAVIQSKIALALDEFTSGKPSNDDITFIVLKRTDSNDYIEELSDSDFELELLY